MDLIHDVIVVGAGFWGTVITLSLRRRYPHQQITCLDSAEPGFASRVAGGLVRLEWLESAAFQKIRPLWWNAAHSQACLDWVEEGQRAGWIRPTKEGRVDRRWLAPGLRQDLYLVDCDKLLGLAKAIRARVVEVQRASAAWNLFTDAGPWAAPTVILAAGVGCDPLLLASGLPTLGVQSVWGEALYGSGELKTPLTYSYRLPGETRTRTATARDWPGGLRIGDTWQDDGSQLAVLREFGGRIGFLESHRLRGARPVLPKLTVEELSSGLIVAAGGHRSGLTSSAGAALRVLELLIDR